MTTTETLAECDTCGNTAWHFPIDVTGIHSLCCYCYNSETPCPDKWCDSHTQDLDAPHGTR